ncbi:MAG: ABC transporter permease [Chloroflexi bacterium]|nr:ABC transporter permease [Chloroflexota bacterium]
MNWRGQLARAWHITAKDMRAYYLKPPLISWGMLFPAVLILAFYLRDPGDIRAAIPGLIGMTVLFGATSVEAVAIAFEKRIGAMERLLMAPIAPYTLVIAKMTSGTLFGLASGCVAWLVAGAAWDTPLTLSAWPILLLGSLAFSLMGVSLSLLMREVFDAMTLTNFFRFPMVFLCGVFVPLGEMTPVLRGVASALPLTYTVDGLRHVLLASTGAYYPLWLDMAAAAGFAVALYAVTLGLLKQRLEELL